MNYYNDNDPQIAAWLSELIRRGLLPPGDVDTRSITEIKPDEVKHYTQCHFFDGIGGWPYALRLAGWPDDRPVWTGSCPCQPFSAAGKRQAQNDKRHLWPDFFRLIRECRPECVFGEQVAAAIGVGWLDGISADLEAEGYAVGAVVLGAHSAGAPHIRQRLYWVANANNGRGQQQSRPCQYAVPRPGESRVLVRYSEPRLEGLGWNEDDCCQLGQDNSDTIGPTAAPGNPWSDAVWRPCLDGKSRRVEPGIRLLADGVSNRVVKLRGLGNAIVPQVAAEFIRAFLDRKND